MTTEANSVIIEELEASVNCAVCLELFKDPRCLPCQHSFCLDCLQGVLGQKEVLSCPICKRVVYVPNGVWELPKDFKANTWLETLSDFKKASEIAATRRREEETRGKNVPAAGGSEEPRPTFDQPPSRRLVWCCLRSRQHPRRDTIHLSNLHNDPGTSSLESPPEDKLTFNPRCGSNVAVHANQITANITNVYSSSKPSIVLTSRYLKPNEIFEVILEKKVKIYVGSIIIGVTTHSARHLEFPPCISNIRSGTWIFSGEQVLQNGKVTKPQYGQDLDAVEVGGRVGVQRKDDGTLHFYINGVDQGVAASGIPAEVYGAIDLFGNAQQATILYTSGNMPEGLLTFHPRCGSEAVVHTNQISAHRNNPLRTFSDGVVLTSRPLKVNELFEIRLDKKVMKWDGTIAIGVTSQSPVALEFPSCIGDIPADTLVLSGRVVKWNGFTIEKQYGKDLSTLKEGDRVGVKIKKKGKIHFYINGVDQGVAASKLPAIVDFYGAIDLHGGAVQATIMDTSGLLDDTSEDGYGCSVS